MDLDKYYKWLDNINTNPPLKYRGLIINGKEAWEEGEKEEQERILEIIKNYIKSAHGRVTMVEICLMRLYNEISGNKIQDGWEK